MGIAPNRAALSESGDSELKRFKHLRGFLRKHLWRYALGVQCLLAVDVLQLIIPRLLANVTDSLAYGQLTPAGLKRHVFLLLGLASAIAAGRFLWRIFINGAARKADFCLRNKLFAHLEKLPASYFNHHKTGDLMAHATNDIPAVRQAMGQGLMLFVDAIFMTAATLFALLRTVPLKLAAVSLLPFPFLAAGTALLSRLAGIRHRRVHEAFARLTDRAQENISGIRVVKSFAQERAEITRFVATARENVAENMGLTRVWGLMEPMATLASLVGFALVLGFGGAMIIRGEISLGDFVACTSYLAMLTWPMIAMGWVINVVQRGFAGLDRLNAILDEVPEVRDEPGAIDLPAALGDIEVRNLTFRYAPDLPPALDGVSFHLRPGEILAVVGRTGCGKSTLMGILTRQYNPPRGTVFIDGIDILDISLHSLRSHIGLAPQEAFLFSTSIAHNISFGDGTYGRDQIAAAAEMAQVKDDIEAFPDGFDTVVGERGVTLSGGQRQRVCIARALIRNPAILLLDDCLSAVDTQTEARILAQLREYMKGRTCVISSHRISAVKHADHIIVLDDGKLVEQGTHESLLAAGGLYADMYERQLLEEELESRA